MDIQAWRVQAAEKTWSLIIAGGSMLLIVVFLVWPESDAPAPQPSDPMVQADPVVSTPEKKPAVVVPAVESQTEKKYVEAILPPSFQPIEPTSPVHRVVPQPAIKTPEKPMQPKPIVKQPVVVEKTAFFVQVGAFKQQKNGKILVKKLQNSGWMAVVFQKNNALYAVQVGPFSSMDKAREIQKRLKVEERMDGFLTKRRL